MTTPEPRLSGAGASLFGNLEALAAQSAGAPAPDLIAQLANKFFAAPSGAPPELPAPLPHTQPVVAPEVPNTSELALSSPPPTPSVSQLSPPGKTPAQPVASLPYSPQITSVPSLPAVTPSAPLSLAAEPDLGALPRSFGSLLSLVRQGSDGAAALPGGGHYFIEDALAAAGTRSLPFAFQSLTLGPESREYSPSRLPEIGSGPRPFDPNAVRRDFPILQEQVHGKRLVWLDNAATTQKPQAVIDRLKYYYEHENSNIHRAAHALAARATDAFESAREKVRRYLNAGSTEEIIFVRGTTEAINLVAQTWGRQNIGKDDEIVITWLEHHANIVPWQQLAAEKGAHLRVAPVDDDGQVILSEFEKLLNPRTKLVSITQVSNALGTVTPVHEMVAAAHRHGARVLVDGAQAVSHIRVDLQTLNPDFYVLSGHKVFGPTGIGALYGRKEVLESMPPWQGGGNMIADVTFERTIFQPAPAKFEAGTGNIADAIGLGAALDYVTSIGLENIGWYEHHLLEYATVGLRTVPGLKIIGTAKEKAGVISFVLNNIRTQDVGAALDKEGIAVRSGHHCAQPILRRFGVEATVRASFAPYNNCEDIDTLVAALLRISATQ
jgi:cysteine desulfurase/selenocysteine lyase